MKKICMIIPYFGKLPNYFEFWLNSCKYNETIKFLIFTDDRTKYDFPHNVNVVYTTLKAMKDLIQSKFEFNISLNNSYKLCDYKPAFGYIFNDYLKGFDFWGHCDLDVIFGDLRKFLPEKKLEQYDKIYRWGHFSLYKNNDKVNKSFLEYKDMSNNSLIYKSIFQTDESMFFDETGKYGQGIVNYYNKNKANLKMYNEQKNIADISVKYNNLIVYGSETDGKCIFEYTVEDNTSKIYSYYKSNKIIQKKEYMYIHLQKRRINVETSNKNNFLIIPDKIVDKDVIYINEKYFNKSCKRISTYRKYFYKMKIENLLKKYYYKRNKN